MILVNPQTREPFTADIEAEDGVLTAPMKVQSSSAASGGQYVVVPEGSGSNLDDVSHGGPGQVRFTVKLPQGGAYSIWARTIAANANSDSFYVMTGPSLIREWVVPQSTTWKWNKIAQVFVGAGTFRLSLRQRDDGTRLDKVLITNDPKVVPD
jgi:hypothetical protein